MLFCLFYRLPSPIVIMYFALIVWANGWKKRETVRIVESMSLNSAVLLLLMSLCWPCVNYYPKKCTPIDYKWCRKERFCQVSEAFKWILATTFLTVLILCLFNKRYLRKVRNSPHTNVSSVQCWKGVVNHTDTPMKLKIKYILAGLELFQSVVCMSTFSNFVCIFSDLVDVNRLSKYTMKAYHWLLNIQLKTISLFLRLCIL